MEKLSDEERKKRQSASQKAYRNKNKEKLRADNKAYRNENKEKEQARQKAYQSKNRGKRGMFGLVVMRTSGEYLGLLTTKEILRFLIYLTNKLKRENKEDDWTTLLSYFDQDSSLITVNDVLIAYEVSARPNQSLFEVIRMMEENDLEILPVADGGKIIGVIQSSDILSLII